MKPARAHRDLKPDNTSERELVVARPVHDEAREAALVDLVHELLDRQRRSGRDSEE